jgi:hypothetical protein
VRAHNAGELIKRTGVREIHSRTALDAREVGALVRAATAD